MKPPTVHLITTVACFLTVAAATASPAAQAGQGVVTGRVTSTVTGNSVAGAVVTVNPGGVAAVTGADGVYQVAVPAGTFSLTVSVQNRPFQSAFGVVVRDGATTTVNFRLSISAATGLLAGVIRSLATGAVIPNATVSVSPGGSSTTTDANGRFELSLPTGTYTVNVSATFYQTVAAAVLVSNQTLTTRDLALLSTPIVKEPAVMETLHVFAASTDGASPESLIRATDGNFYGTAAGGGEMGRGTIFTMTPDGTFTVLHAFAGGDDGRQPLGLVQGTDGDLYGTTARGGASDSGTAFKMTLDGVFTVLHQFSGGHTDAAYPRTRLIEGSDGAFYGIAGSRYGTVFNLTPDGTVTLVHTFSGVDGEYPSELLLATDGNLYGTTVVGGSAGRGTAFRISPAGIFTSLRSFGGPDGVYPANLIQGSDGDFYGTSSGTTVFRMTPTGVVTTLRALPFYEDFHRLFQAADGNFYLTTFGPDSYFNFGEGSIYRITPAGAVTTLHTSPSGAAPCAGLVQGTDGNFYGTICYGYGYGGSQNGQDGGTLFRLTLSSTPAELVTESVSGNPKTSPIVSASTAKSGDASAARVDASSKRTTVRTEWSPIPLKTGTIAGQVRDSRTNAPISNAKLRFSPGDTSVTTDSMGRYRLSLPEGTYTVTVSAAGARNSSRSGVAVVYQSMTTLDLTVSRPPARDPMFSAFRAWDMSPTRPFAQTMSRTNLVDARAWEIEAFGGATFTSQPTGGTGALPPVGDPFVTATGQPSRRVSSWYLGGGAQLLNGVNGAIGVGEQITPLDAALQSSLVQGNAGGGGVRVSRILTPWVTAEATFEFSTVRAELSSDAANAIENSRVSFLSAWNGLASAGQFTDTTVTSVRTVQIENGHQIVATGAINVALKKTGKVIPYLTGGAGVSSHSGTAVNASLVGDYQFALGGITPFHETDSVTVRYTVADNVMVGVLGAGLKYMVSPRVGLRFDYRTYLGPNRRGTFVDSNPVVSTLTPAGSGASATTPGIQFSNDAGIGLKSSLSGSPLVDFRTFTGSGMQRDARLTMGLFWRF